MTTTTFDAFEVSPVPAAGSPAPEPFRGIYAMPAFVTITTADLETSVDFWTRGIGFIDLFSVPGRITHLRRWMFQDVLLVPMEDIPAAQAEDARAAPTGISVSFACVLDELDGIAAACRALRAGSATDPYDTPWNTRDVTVTTPEGARVVLTAARPFDPDGPEARSLAEMGIRAPKRVEGGDNDSRG
ncbi:VOC family protein [Microbacterium sediminis]|uniref:Glycosyltransferase n=1 Tax=Microbacterium sediminis TaxID=904291 RepID=A0A1B9NFH5_9MICO|nr:VOC family protein [Microbacterium sediminis]OCG75361.1 glycosyltransferase [Microbacterium sediminis]QBR74388.1 VOC family protein [Microbacterium sediminis]